jgi:hypothetical protein
MYVCPECVRLNLSMCVSKQVGGLPRRAKVEWKRFRVTLLLKGIVHIESGHAGHRKDV